MNFEEDNEKEFSKPTKLPINLIISEGNKYLRLLQFDKAISSFEKIIDRDPSNVQSILGRAKCYMRLAKHKEAWQDFQKILKLNPKCIEAIHLKGVTEYLRGNFEKGFLTYWQGYEMKPFCSELRQGYQLCEKAIENTLNADERMLLTEKDTDNMNTLLKNKRLHDGKIDYYSKGMFSSDLKMLDDMLKDKKLTHIHSLCKDLFEYLKERQKFWKMQKPCSNGNKSSSMIFIKNNGHNLMKMNQLIRNYSLCKTALRDGKIGICVKKGNEVLDILTNISSNFPQKNEIQAETFHCLIMAHLIKEELSMAEKYCNHQLRTVKKHNMVLVKTRAYRDFGEIYYATGKYEKALHFFKKSLQFVQSKEEKTVLLYKISDCNIHLRNLENAQETAQKCLDMVVSSHNKRFQFDVLLLSAEIYVKGKNMKIAEEYYKQALEIAVENNDKRQKQLEYLLEIFEEVATKDSYSNERIQIVQITDSMKYISSSEK